MQSNTSTPSTPPPRAVPLEPPSVKRQKRQVNRSWRHDRPLAICCRKLDFSIPTDEQSCQEVDQSDQEANALIQGLLGPEFDWVTK